MRRVMRPVILSSLLKGLPNCQVDRGIQRLFLVSELQAPPRTLSANAWLTKPCAVYRGRSTVFTRFDKCGVLLPDVRGRLVERGQIAARPQGPAPAIPEGFAFTYTGATGFFLR